jgi:hypothetical protein
MIAWHKDTKDALMNVASATATVAVLFATVAAATWKINDIKQTSLQTGLDQGNTQGYGNGYERGVEVGKNAEHTCRSATDAEFLHEIRGVTYPLSAQNEEFVAYKDRFRQIAHTACVERIIKASAPKSPKVAEVKDSAPWAFAKQIYRGFRNAL